MMPSLAVGEVEGARGVEGAPKLDSLGWTWQSASWLDLGTTEVGTGGAGALGLCGLLRSGSIPTGDL